MEDLRSTRRHRGSAPPKSAYADVFGGPPKFSAAKSDDYAEIFGGGADSCNIPFLDLPHPPPTNQNGGGIDGPIDYEEIFGKKASGAADCGLLDYEELFGKKKGNKKEKKKEKEKEVSYSSSDGRIPKEAEFCQQEKDTSKVYVEGVCTEKNLFLPSSMYSDDGSKICSMSYNMTSHGSIEDVLNGSTHVTQSCTIDSLQGMQTNDSHKVVKNDHIFSAGYNGGVTAEEQVNIVPSTFPGDSTKSCEAELKTDQKEFTNRCPAPVEATTNVWQEEATANAQHHSRSSSNHSTSSGDVFIPDITYVTISDISLRTQPCQVPPPSRAPPKLVSKQGQPKMKSYVSLPKTTGNHKTHYSLGISKSHSLNKTAKDGSPFYDVEVDASSAAAAMKEAMEQAQARLKSAKELMERKRENLQNRKKLGLRESIIFDEKTENNAANEVNIFSEVKTSKTLLKEEGATKEYALKEREKSITMAKAAPIEVKERYVVSAGEDEEIVEGNRFRTPQTSYKLEEISGEWKMNQEFYELVKSNNNSPVVKEVYKQEDLQKNQKICKKINKDNENYVKPAELSCDERNGKPQQVNKTSDRKENVEHLSSGNMAFYEKIWERPNTILKACTGKENLNKLHESHDSLQRREIDKKLEAFQEAHVSKNELERLNIAEGVIEENCASGESKTSIEFSETCEFEGVALGEENMRKLEGAEEDCGCNNEEKLGGTSVSSITLDTENRQKKAGIAGMQAKTENEAQGISRSCMLEVLEQLESLDETRREADSEYDVEENGYKFEGNRSALEEHNRRLHGDGEAGIFVENGLQSEVVEDANQSEADLEKHEAAQGTLRHTEHERITKLTEEVSLQELNETKSREAEGEIHYEEKQKAAQEHCELENFEEAVVSEEGPKKMDTEKVGEVHMSVDLDEMHKRSDEDKDVCQINVDKYPEDVQQANFWDKKFKLQSSAEDNIESHQVNSQSLAQAATERHHTLLTENAAPDMHELEKRENTRRDGREKEKEQARNFEEEKEREREKDRLAVERATREAHERKIAEARGRAERIAVERVTAEARQRALAEAREKAEKAAAEALEKSLAEKSLKEAKLRAERAAVERATAEARERAVEKALAEKAASDARQRAERLNATSRDSRATDREDRETKLKPSFLNIPSDARFQGASSAISSQKYTDSYIRGESDSPLRCKAKLERHQRTVERAAKALEEKNMRDILAQREQAERNRLSESLDADVKRWSTGKEGNLRALLSTLQYILGPESGWHPVPLTDVITAVAAKKAYRKATLCVHPDKLQQRGASIQQKYICEKVFDLLKEAWNRFNSEER